MSELELNQMHDWEDKCNEASMKQELRCICTQLIEHGIPNPDCPRHGALYKQDYGKKDEYIKLLEQKLIDIECGECGKNMLECQCEDE